MSGGRVEGVRDGKVVDRRCVIRFGSFVGSWGLVFLRDFGRRSRARVLDVF